MSAHQRERTPLLAVADKLPSGGANSHGNPMSMGDLPPSDTVRWTVRRKAAVVEAIRAGVITTEQACERYALSVEEFLSWQRQIDSHGLRGLRSTKIQDYRPDRKRN